MHRHGAIRINDIDDDVGSAPDAEFCRVENVDLSAEPTRESLKCAGLITSDKTIVTAIDPVLRWTVKDLAELLLLNSIEDGRGAHDIEVYLHEVETTSLKPKAKTATVHDYYEIYDANIYWTEFRLESAQTALAQCVADILFDPEGANATPFAMQEDVAMPTITGGHDTFTLGPASLNGTALPNVNSITVQNEYQFDEDASRSRQTDFREARPINDAITRIRVVLKERINWTATIAAAGTDLNGTTGFQFYARKQGYALSASQHILWKAESGTMYPVNFTGSGANIATDEFVIDVQKTDYLPNGDAKAGSGLHLTGTPLQAIP